MDDIKMIDVICRCGLHFRVSEGCNQVWHSITCRDFYADKDATDYRRAWKRANDYNYREAMNNGKKRINEVKDHDDN